MSAHHKAVSRHRWQLAQQRELARWTGPEALHRAREHARKVYLPHLRRHTEHLPDEMEVLEIGPGPVCAASMLEKGRKTYVDPLSDDFRRIYPGELPEGNYLVAMAEQIPCPDHSFDCIIALNVLGYVLNPELVLNELERLLKPGGVLFVGMTVFSSLEARLQYFLHRCLPSLGPEGRPYCYSYDGIRRTLERHFEIRRDIRLNTGLQGWQAWLGRQERLFVCGPKGRRPSSGSP